jgi:hypothetical protein
MISGRNYIHFLFHCTGFTLEEGRNVFDQIRDALLAGKQEPPMLFGFIIPNSKGKIQHYGT